MGVNRISTVPLEEADGTFDLNVSGIRILRWIRKHIDQIRAGLQEAAINDSNAAL